jgi:hypothetical protein
LISDGDGSEDTRLPQIRGRRFVFVRVRGPLTGPRRRVQVTSTPLSALMSGDQSPSSPPQWPLRSEIGISDLVARTTTIRQPQEPIFEVVQKLANRLSGAERRATGASVSNCKSAATFQFRDSPPGSGAALSYSRLKRCLSYLSWWSTTLQLTKIARLPCEPYPFTESLPACPRRGKLYPVSSLEEALSEERVRKIGA